MAYQDEFRTGSDIYEQLEHLLPPWHEMEDAREAARAWHGNSTHVLANEYRPRVGPGVTRRSDQGVAPGRTVTIDVLDEPVGVKIQIRGRGGMEVRQSLGTEEGDDETNLRT